MLLIKNSKTTQIINLGGTYYGDKFTQNKAGQRSLYVAHEKKKFSDFSWYRGNMNAANTGRTFYIYFNNSAIQAGVISAGSTGALMAGGLFILGRIQGIDRPALASVYPILGKKAALFVFLIDALKGFAAVSLAQDMTNTITTL